MPNTLSAHDVAKYFISLVCEDEGDNMTNLKLQKLVYYAQGYHIAMFDKPLFSDEIQAWLHGPVVPSLYRTYKEHGSGAIPCPSDLDISIYSQQQKDFLDEIYKIYGQYSASALRAFTHNESTWISASKNGTVFNAVITHQALKNYFSTQIEG